MISDDFSHPIVAWRPRGRSQAILFISDSLVASFIILYSSGFQYTQMNYFEYNLFLSKLSSSINCTNVGFFEDESKNDRRIIYDFKF